MSVCQESKMARDKHLPHTNRNAAAGANVSTLSLKYEAEPTAKFTETVFVTSGVSDAKVILKRPLLYFWKSEMVPPVIITSLCVKFFEVMIPA